MKIETDFNIGDVVYSRSYNNKTKFWEVVKVTITKVVVEAGEDGTRAMYLCNLSDCSADFMPVTFSSRNKAVSECKDTNNKLKERRKEDDYQTYMRYKKFIDSFDKEEKEEIEKRKQVGVTCE